MSIEKIFKGKLSFKYTLNHKNWGFIDDDEPFEHFYEGQITSLYSPKFPKTVGMFELMVYEFDKAKHFNQFEPMIEMMNDLSVEPNSRFTNLSKLINDYDLNFKDKSKIIYLKNVIIHPEYRGKNVLDELIKSIYITHYNKNALYLVNMTPMQIVSDDLDFYFDLNINILDGYNNETSVIAGDYYNVNNLPSEYDELIDYKLFARMQKLNFTKFEDTNYFYLKNEEDILKLFKK